MVTRRLAPRVQRNARRAKAQPVEHVYGVPVPEGLHEAIEIRDRFRQRTVLPRCGAAGARTGAAVDQRLGFPGAAAAPAAEQNQGRPRSMACGRALCRPHLRRHEPRCGQTRYVGGGNEFGLAEQIDRHASRFPSPDALRVPVPHERRVAVESRDSGLLARSKSIDCVRIGAPRPPRMRRFARKVRRR